MRVVCGQWHVCYGSIIGRNALIIVYFNILHIQWNLSNLDTMGGGGGGGVVGRVKGPI